MLAQAGKLFYWHIQKVTDKPVSSRTFPKRNRSHPADLILHYIFEIVIKLCTVDSLPLLQGLHALCKKKYKHDETLTSTVVLCCNLLESLLAEQLLTNSV